MSLTSMQNQTAEQGRDLMDCRASTRFLTGENLRSADGLKRSKCIELPQLSRLRGALPEHNLRFGEHDRCFGRRKTDCLLINNLRGVLSSSSGAAEEMAGGRVTGCVVLLECNLLGGGLEYVISFIFFAFLTCSVCSYMAMYLYLLNYWHYKLINDRDEILMDICKCPGKPQKWIPPDPRPVCFKRGKQVDMDEKIKVTEGEEGEEEEDSCYLSESSNSGDPCKLKQRKEEQGKNGEGKDGKDGEGKDGKKGEGKDGKNGEGKDGKKGEGKDGKKGEGKDGKKGSTGSKK
ncbi:unnamed protein product [Cyprideis torosa]|uniref:Uncharacterized protein n=1 Tax=Cyprideis torosa TaxID=163714 RepID=A0A7R8WDC7_9CRUS|nr:unnamed protein product [Cyprideis torosa]CAG0889370.1 unnamed protein product [Cyprideis torosa]